MVDDALEEAVRNGCFETLTSALSLGADADLRILSATNAEARELRGRELTPLAFVISRRRRRRFPLIRRLIDAKADLEVGPARERTRAR